MLKLITAPATDLISVARAKERLFIEDDSRDSDLARLIAAAVEMVEKSANLILRSSEWEYRESGLRGCAYDTRFDGTIRWYGPVLQIPAAPVRDVTEIRYLDADGLEHTVDSAKWSWERTEEGADMRLAAGYYFPVLSTSSQAIRVAFSAGYDAPDTLSSGDDPELSLPAMAEIAVLFLVEHWNRFRTSVSTDQAYQVPDTFEKIIEKIKVYR